MLSKNACSSAALRAPAGDTLHRPAVRGERAYWRASRCRQRCDRALAVWKGRLLDRLRARPVTSARTPPSTRDLPGASRQVGPRCGRWPRKHPGAPGVRARGLARRPDARGQAAGRATAASPGWRIMAESVVACDGASVDFHLQRGSRTGDHPARSDGGAASRAGRSERGRVWRLQSPCVYARAGLFRTQSRAGRGLRLRPQLTEWSKQTRPGGAARRAGLSGALHLSRGAQSPTAR